MTAAPGSIHHAAKLNEAQVVEIKKLLNKQVRQSDIAERFGVDRTTISNINRGKTWDHVRLAPKRVVNREPAPCVHAAAHEHGTNLMYVADRCRCVPCMTAHAAFGKRRRRMIGYGTYQNWMQPAKHVHDHVMLLRRHGIGSVQLAKLTGLSEYTFRRILNAPETHRVQSRTARKILAVQPGQSVASKGARMPADGTRRRLQALIAIGWAQTQLGDAMGLSQGTMENIHHNPTVRVATARVVAEYYDRMWDKPAPASRKRKFALNMARARRFYPPLAWDDDEIDDPAASPHGEWKAVA